MTTASHPVWKEKARARQNEQLLQIPESWRLAPAQIPSPLTSPSAIEAAESCGVLSPSDLEYTKLSNTVPLILQNIRHGRWKSFDVTLAFCKRAALLQQLTGCLTEIMFSDALTRAQELDAILAQTGQPVGPLHGLPFSIKDNHDVRGYDSTVGWVGLIGKPAAEDHPAVAEYRRLGAVLYVKTNVPQSMMMSDSYNHVFGQSVNSLNRNLISGGSSGGEAALIAAGGSVIGVGTDIGGSVRIPATLQGLYGLSPTSGRVGNRENVRYQKYLVAPVAGPLTRDLDSMEWFMEALLRASPWERDPGLLPVPWRGDVVKDIRQKERLKIGYVLDDGVVLPQPPVTRAIRELVARLQHAGHDVFEWDTSDHRKGHDLWLKAVLADGGKRCAELCTLAHEPLIRGMLVGTEKDLLDTAQRQELADEIWTYQREYLRRWADAEVDAIIMPVTQWVGMKPKVWVKSDMYVGYTGLINLLNWTALTIPSTQVSAELDQPNEGWRTHAARSFSDQFNHDLYDVQEFSGMPVGVQLVTGRFGEEAAIGLAHVIASLPVG